MNILIGMAWGILVAVVGDKLGYSTLKQLSIVVVGSFVLGTLYYFLVN